MRLIFANKEYYMYFIQVENSGPIKIGISKDVKKRMGDLQVANPFRLKLLYFTPCCKEDEDSLHRILMKRKLNVRGEWFWPDEIIFQYIKGFKEIDKREGFDWENHKPEEDLIDMRIGSKWWFDLPVNCEEALNAI